MLLTVTLLNVIVQQAINTWDIPLSHIFEILMNMVTILSFFFLIFFEVIPFLFLIFLLTKLNLPIKLLT